MPGGMTREWDELHAVHDRLGPTERMPLAGLDVRRRDVLRTLEERLCILRRLGCDFWRQPKVAFCLRDIDLGVRKDAIPVLCGETADMIGVEVRDQDEVDLFLRVACAAEASRHAPGR